MVPAFLSTTTAGPFPVVTQVGLGLSGLLFFEGLIGNQEGKALDASVLPGLITIGVGAFSKTWLFSLLNSGPPWSWPSWVL